MNEFDLPGGNNVSGLDGFLNSEEEAEEEGSELSDQDILLEIVRQLHNQVVLLRVVSHAALSRCDAEFREMVLNDILPNSLDLSDTATPEEGAGLSVESETLVQLFVSLRENQNESDEQ